MNSRAFLFAALLLTTSSAFAEEGETPWRASGDISLDYSNYQYSGALAGSPYNFTGNQWFSTLNSTFNKSLSNYESLGGRFTGLVNRSDYRSQYKNASVEQFSFNYEKGDAAIPFALDGGDIYASFSPRSLQSPLKGAALELQPTSSGAWRHSVALVSGFDQGIYRQINFDKSVFAGASWLMENEAYGSVLLNNVYNYKRPDSAVSTVALEQNVTTVAGETEFNIAGQTLNAETEIGTLVGDLAGSTPTTTRKDKLDSGFFARLDGSSKIPLTYSIEFERNGAHYAPAGAVVTSNQSRLESNLGWRFADGLRLSGRHSRIETNLETSNPLWQHDYSARLSGPFGFGFVSGLTGTIDGTMTETKDAAETNRTRSYVSGLSLAKTLDESWTARYGFRWRQNRNQILGNISNAQDHSFGLDNNWSFDNWNGAFSPGFVLTESYDNTRSDFQIGPQFSASAANGGHALNVSYQLRQIDQKLPVTGIFTQSATARYSYTVDEHNISVSGDYFHRNPDGALYTDAWRTGVTYTYNFDFGGEETATPTQTASISGADDTLLKPTLGITLGKWRENLTENNLGTPSQSGELYTLSDKPFSRINLRQQLAYRFDNGKLTKHGVIFEPDSEDPSSLARDYQSVLSELIRKYGRPSATYDTGDFSLNLAEDIASGRFRRLAEWKKNDRVLRFGLPRQLNNSIRFELVGADSFASPNNPLWGLK